MNARPWLAPLALTLACTALTACSDSDDDEPGTGPSDDAPLDGGADAAVAPDADAGGTGPDDGSGGDGANVDGVPGTGGDVSMYGNVALAHDGFADETEVFASFIRLDRALPAAALDEQLPSVDADRCERRETGPGVASPDTDVELDFGDLPFASVGAGEFLTFTFDGGTYASLPRRREFGFVIYATEDDAGLPGGIPSPLAVEITGEPDGFPGFGTVALPTADPLRVTLDEGTQGITWNGATAGDGAIELSISGTVGEGDPPGFETIDCTLVDDGAYTVPDGLFGAPLTQVFGATAERRAHRVVREGVAVLLLEASASGTVDVER